MSDQETMEFNVPDDSRDHFFWYRERRPAPALIDLGLEFLKNEGRDWTDEERTRNQQTLYDEWVSWSMQ